MAIDPVSLGVAAGVNVLAPVVAKGIGGLFGLDEPSEEEQRAARLRQEAIGRLTAAAEGRTASPAQLAAQQAAQRTQQALIGMAQRGTVQQRAGNVRAAMQAAPEVMAQQSAVAAQTRAAEMDRAREMLANAQMQTASAEAAQGRANREYMQRLVGAGIQGAAGVAGESLMRAPGADPSKLSATEIADYNAAREAERAGKQGYATGGTSGDMGRGFMESLRAAPRQGSSAGQVSQAVGSTVQSVASPLALGVKRLGAAITPGANSQVMQQSQEMDRLRSERRAAVPSPLTVGRAAVFGPTSSPAQARGSNSPYGFASLADRMQVQNEMAPYMRTGGY